MRFTKMQGLGNDYLYVFGDVPADAPALARRLSDRHFGVGADGMIYITPSSAADFGMRIFNADGSEAMMCGNGIRCVGKYVYDRGHTAKTALTIETRSGVRTLALRLRGGRVASVSVEMGRAIAAAPTVLAVGGEAVTLIPVSVGNPHAVIFVDDAEAAPLTELGPLIERHPTFDGGVNVEFVEVRDRTQLRMRVWERGSGVTLACGTGACASVAAAIAAGHCDAGVPVTVVLDGGALTVTVDADGETQMEGPAAFICDGEIDECVEFADNM